MGAPQYVPVDPTAPKFYKAPPRRARGWVANRPGDLDGPQPTSAGFGRQGPDQGYALLLARQLIDDLTLAAGEKPDDVMAGILAVALKRASIFGRAPMMEDLKVAAAVWGFNGLATQELVELRRSRFEEIANPHHYAEGRVVADLVPDEVLRRSPVDVAAMARADWRSVLGPLPE